VRDDSALSRESSPLDPDFEQLTHRVEDRHWWYGGRRRIVASVLRSTSLPAAPEILDAGCGSGRNMVWLARLGRVTGLEAAPESIELARARGAGPVVEASLEEPLPLPGACFDLALALDVIEHLDRDVAALEELRRVVRPGGRLLVTVPAYPRLWSYHDDVNGHRRRYTRRTLLEAAAAAGWTPERTSHFNALLLPAAALWRLRPGARRGGSDLESTPPRLDRLLELPLRAEAALLARGGRLPAGLSLLVLLRSGGG
jgi:SAM-dependent methyltransferase